MIVGIDCSGEARTARPGVVRAPVAAERTASAPAPPPPEATDIGIRVAFDRSSDGAQCIRLVDFVGPGEATSTRTAQAEQVFLEALATTPQCQGPDAVPALASTPLIEAARFWQRMDLPELAPRIAPGKALVGLPAYLETGGAPTVTAGGPTPFGPLTITATRSVTVDWADGPGSVTGPHTGVGGPHPDGDITWVYGRSGDRDVAVTQTWTATWSIGPAGGTFSGRGTTSTLFGFPVEQVQAVRDR